LDCGVVQALAALPMHHIKSVYTASVWCLGNITCSMQELVKAVLAMPDMPHGVVQLLRTATVIELELLYRALHVETVLSVLPRFGALRCGQLTLSPRYVRLAAAVAPRCATNFVVVLDSARMR
jgi:hypothetical protein